jgi:hypothetical protein
MATGKSEEVLTLIKMLMTAKKMKCGRHTHEHGRMREGSSIIEPTGAVAWVDFTT